VLFGTALHQIHRYQTKGTPDHALELIQSFHYTTLYSSCLFHHANEQVLFAAGTVFGQLILYSQDVNGAFHETATASDHNVKPMRKRNPSSTPSFYSFRVRYSASLTIEICSARLAMIAPLSCTTFIIRCNCARHSLPTMRVSGNRR
jgi:hypothetical protein